VGGLNIDSTSKIIQTYFSAVTIVPFEYKGITYQPHDLTVSPLLVRGYTCPEGCGGCCHYFSLDYLPSEPHPYTLKERFIDFDGRKVRIFSDMQEEHSGPRCKHVDKIGRCGIHGVHPFSCRFELIRFNHFAERPNQLSTRLFGRGWSYNRVDGGKGALCEIIPADEKRVEDLIENFLELEKWADHFGILTCIKEIVEWIHDKQYLIGPLRIVHMKKGKTHDGTLF
jgi:hypothetical protein